VTLSLAHTVAEVRQAVASARARGQTIGLVPTMGALHEGHASLLRTARRETGFVILSIFVNPTQFGPTEDFARYPRPLEQDLALAEKEGVDLVFFPEVKEMYPEGFGTLVEVSGLQDVLCGASRPGHFRGVATVVLKLFHIVQPDTAYFGQKDAQQARLIQQMVRDLNVPVTISVQPIVREPDGLALSSRNVYLTPEQRRQATILYRALEEGRALVQAGERSAAAVTQRLTSLIQATPGAQVDYVAVVDGLSLQPLERLHGKVLVALAVKFGATRLIDNRVMDLPP
jgi:pantoate--beta-alanine ligase